ncbi:MAG: hypothetical protein U1E70_11475 [Acetobacteraceae bacterium]
MKKACSMALPPYRTIYLLCHAHVRTGGPEAIHQLGRALRDLGHDARIVYIKGGLLPQFEPGWMRFPVIDDPTPPAYAHYAVPGTWDVEDAPDVAVVLPEVEPVFGFLFKQAIPHLWWLSIDHGLKPVQAINGFQRFHGTRFIHLCQSYYALAYLRQHDLYGLPLFDYTAPEHTDAAASAAATFRQDRIVYPARSAWYAQYLRKWTPDLDWQEIKGFTPAQVQELFLTSKVYVDFGGHPGKDRMPREAALLGCCVMTGRNGAADNPFDVPIPERYKFRGRRWQVPAIARAIRTTLANYEQRNGDFAMYRRIISGERAEFIAQAQRVFGTGTHATASATASQPALLGVNS